MDKTKSDCALTTNVLSVACKVLPGKMGRRRRKTLRVVKRSLPKVFACPRCGMLTVRITSHQDETSQDTVFMVACGNTGCGLRRELRYPTRRAEIDVYNTFVDDFARAGA